MRNVLGKVTWLDVKGAGYGAKKEFVLLLMTLKDFKDPLLEVRATTNTARSVL